MEEQDDNILDFTDPSEASETETNVEFTTQSHAENSYYSDSENNNSEPDEPPKSVRGLKRDIDVIVTRLNRLFGIVHNTRVQLRLIRKPFDYTGPKPLNTPWRAPRFGRFRPSKRMVRQRGQKMDIKSSRNIITDPKKKKISQKTKKASSSKF